MSSSRNSLGVLAIAGALLSGAPSLLGSALDNPNVGQNSYYLATAGGEHSVSERERPQDKGSVQENNAGMDDTQVPILPTVVTPQPTMRERNDNRK